MKSFISMVMVFATLTAIAQNKDDKRIMADSEKAKAKIQKMNVGLDQFFDNASGYAIFPNVGEGGFILGAASGNGVLYEGGQVAGMADLKKLDVGFQVGGQAVIEIIFFETEDALNEFKQGEFEFTAEVSATALEKGKSINANYEDGVVVFVKPKKGLMADASVGGQKFNYTALEDLEE